ncbi:hypothetical protein [Pseudarthrobacter oxydans]|uniref:hypothetical protein n=1 Tax=Pseudarthrobacter oxydans TaxID=1671 RepID=UPI001FE35048|nr:hypothetical protein [Pseudarthrobacter oxydans]
MKVIVFCLALTSTLTACTAGPTPEPSETSTTRSAEPNTESPVPTKRAPTSSNATFNGVEFDVAFSFDYPATWTVTNTGPPNQEGGPFVVSNESGAEIASLHLQPQFSAYPCERVCGDMAVSYLGEVPGQGMLGDKTYVIQTKAMDLTSRKDLQKANRWEDNVRLIVGVVGNPSTAQQEDPSHFTTLAGIDVPSNSSPLRPIIFAAYRHFETMTEAKAYTSSNEHAQIQEMMRSLMATAVTGTPTTTATPTGPH